MALQITNISAILKKIIVPVIHEQIAKEAILYNKLKRNSGVTITNNAIYAAARTTRHSGIYSVAEGTEPRTGKASYDQPYDSIKYTFGTLELSDQAIEAASNGDKKAIAAILATEVKALKDDIKKDINRQWYGDGTGTLCLCNGTGSQKTTVTVDSPGTRYIVPGMFVQISTNSAQQVLTVPNSTQFTIGTALDWADNAKVYKENASGTSEMMGLKGIIDTGTYVGTIHNIVRSSNAWAQSQTEDTAATLTEAQMIDLWMKCKEYGNPQVWLLGANGYSKYGSILTSLKQTRDLSEILSGGWKGLSFMDIGVYLDYDVPEISAANFMGFLLDFDSITVAEMAEPFSWLEADAHGGILKRSASNRTVWEGTLKYYANLLGMKFRCNGRLDAKQK